MDKSWRVVLAFIGIFIAGTVTGGLITLQVVQKVADRRHGQVFRANAQNQVGQTPAGQQSQPPQLGPQLIRRFVMQLDLTAEQREKIKPIELRGAEEIRRAVRDARHSTDVILERTQDEIGAILTPEQRTKFEEMVARARERIQKYRQEQEKTLRERRGQGGPNRVREGAPAKDK